MGGYSERERVAVIRGSGSTSVAKVRLRMLLAALLATFLSALLPAGSASAVASPAHQSCVGVASSTLFSFVGDREPKTMCQHHGRAPAQLKIVSRDLSSAATTFSPVATTAPPQLSADAGALPPAAARALSERATLATPPPTGVAAEDATALSRVDRVGSALSKDDPFHRSVSWVVDNPDAQRFAITGGDGVARELYQLPGELNGKSGVFEWILDESGSNPVINHQRFIPGGGVTGYPNQVP